MPLIRVFGLRDSPFVEKAARALEYRGLEFELVSFTGMGDLKKRSPETGKMPVLEIDGERVYDSTFILRRLDEIEPSPPLLSPDPAVAAQQRLLEDWSDESLYWYVMAMRWAPENQRATTDQLLGLMPAPAPLRALVRRMLIRKVGGAARAHGLARLPIAILERELGGMLDSLVAILGDRPFFHADRPSVADLAIHGQLVGAGSGPTPQAERLMNARPALLDWIERVERATATST